MFQKKVKEEEEPTSLTEKEIKSLKDKLTEKSENLDDLKIKDLKMNDLIPQVYNNVVITIMDGYSTLDLPYGMDRGKFKTFQKSAGGAFHRDVLNFSRGKKHGKYLLVEGKNERKIVRLIEDEELTAFKSLRLVKGILKDKPYMVLKNLMPDEKLTGVGRYIKENSEHDEVEETININIPVINSEDDDFESHTSSVSLFDE
jgi:hypothetical protein